MAQKAFGRRRPLPAGTGPSAVSDTPSAASPDVGAALALADAPSRSATRSVMILAGIGGLAMVLVLAGAYGLNAAISTGDSTAQSQQECRGQPNCLNQYNVALECGASDEPKLVTIEARDSEAAERKAERYNRSCRSRSAVFVTSLIRSAARTAIDGYRYEDSRPIYTYRARATRGVWRFRFRLR
jgi:hypothetical protein